MTCRGHRPPARDRPHLYAELLDQALQAEAEAVAARLPAPGSFVSKEVRGGTYWYLQRSESGHRRQYYLGRDTPALRRWMDEVSERRHERAPDDRRRAEIVAMPAAGGAFRERPAVARVLRLLAEAPRSTRATRAPRSASAAATCGWTC